MFTFRFNIEEQPDAKSFLFYDITGTYSAVNTGGWGTPNMEYTDVTSAKIVIKEHKTSDIIEYTLPIDAELWSEGVEFFHPTTGIFSDGAYEFTMYINEDPVYTRSFGFAALIKSEVMVQSLTYKPEMDRRLKELILEKIRLLDNLFYAGEINQIEYFLNNLDYLQKLR